MRAPYTKSDRGSSLAPAHCALGSRTMWLKGSHRADAAHQDPPCAERPNATLDGERCARALRRIGVGPRALCHQRPRPPDGRARWQRGRSQSVGRRLGAAWHPAADADPLFRVARRAHPPAQRRVQRRHRCVWLPGQLSRRVSDQGQSVAQGRRGHHALWPAFSLRPRSGEQTRAARSDGDAR